MMDDDEINVKSFSDNQASVFSLRNQVSRSRYLSDWKPFSTTTGDQSNIDYTKEADSEPGRVTIGNSLIPNASTHSNWMRKDALLRGRVILSGELSISFPAVNAVQRTDPTETGLVKQKSNYSSVRRNSWRPSPEGQIEALRSRYLPPNKRTTSTHPFSKLNTAAHRTSQKDGLNGALPEVGMCALKNERRACTRNEVCRRRHGTCYENPLEIIQRLSLSDNKNSNSGHGRKTNVSGDDSQLPKPSRVRDKRDGPTDYVSDESIALTQGLREKDSHAVRHNQANSTLKLYPQPTAPNGRNVRTDTKQIGEGIMRNNLLNKRGRCGKLVPIASKPPCFKRGDNRSGLAREKLERGSRESNRGQPSQVQDNQNLNQPGSCQIFVISVESVGDSFPSSDDAVAGASPSDAKRAPTSVGRKSSFLSVPTTDVLERRPPPMTEKSKEQTKQYTRPWK